MGFFFPCSSNVWELLRQSGGVLSYVAADLVYLWEELSSRSLYVIVGIVKGGKILFLKLL